MTPAPKGRRRARRTTVSVSSVDGVGDVLVDQEGAALYAADQEADGTVALRRQLHAIWVPLTLDGGSRPAATASDASSASSTRPDGARQVTFDGRLLYSFAEDTGPGIVTGNGVSDTFGDQPFTWHVATPDRRVDLERELEHVGRRRHLRPLAERSSPWYGGSARTTPPGGPVTPSR